MNSKTFTVPTDTPTDRPPPQPYTLWRPSQFAAFTPDPSACLLGAGYLELGLWTSFVGIGGLGKSRIVLWLCICQITGKPWCGIPTNGTPQRAVILSTENGLRRWKTDLGLMLAGLTESERATVEEHLLILALSPDEEGDLCLGSPDVPGRLKVTLGAANPGIVVFDPFADLQIGDENKAVDLIATLRALRAITRTACPTAAVVIIHHARTGAANVMQAGDNFSAGNFGRGSKALYSRVRCEIQLAPKDRDDANQLVLACGKANDSEKFQMRCVVFNPETFTYHVDENFDPEAWRADVAGERKTSTLSIADLVGAVHEKAPTPGDETTTAELVELFKDAKVSTRTLQRQLKAAVNAGYLRDGKKRGKWRLGSKPLPR